MVQTKRYAFKFTKMFLYYLFPEELPIKFNYSLGNTNLLRISIVYDLGVKFD
jgi:hypothetical protein